MKTTFSITKKGKEISANIKGDADEISSMLADVFITQPDVLTLVFDATIKAVKGPINHP